MLYENKNNSVLHVHIPRTGGRWISSLLGHPDNSYEMVDPHLANSHLFDQNEIEFLHESDSNYRLLYGNEVSSFTVVRDPMDRFISASRALNPEHMWFVDWTAEYLEDLFRRANGMAWIKPQTEFISPQTKIWRYEDGLGENFCEWLREEVGVTVNYRDAHYDVFKYDKRPHCTTGALLEFVSEYYENDRKVLGYEPDCKI